MSRSPSAVLVDEPEVCPENEAELEELEAVDDWVQLMVQIEELEEEHLAACAEERAAAAGFALPEEDTPLNPLATAYVPLAPTASASAAAEQAVRVSLTIMAQEPPSPRPVDDADGAEVCPDSAQELTELEAVEDWVALMIHIDELEEEHLAACEEQEELLEAVAAEANGDVHA